MGARKENMKYRIELSEKQLKVIMKTLERYFRLNTGQFFDFVDDIAFEGFEYDKSNPDNSRMFDERIVRRNKALSLFDEAFRIAHPLITKKSEDTNRAIDIFMTFRYNLWKWKPEPKSHGTVDSCPPLLVIAEPLPKIERIEE